MPSSIRIFSDLMSSWWCSMLSMIPYINKIAAFQPRDLMFDNLQLLSSSWWSAHAAVGIFSTSCPCSSCRRSPSPSLPFVLSRQLSGISPLSPPRSTPSPPWDEGEIWQQFNGNAILPRGWQVFRDPRAFFLGWRQPVCPQGNQDMKPSGKDSTIQVGQGPHQELWNIAEGTTDLRVEFSLPQ